MRILILDDEPLIAMDIAEILAAHCDAECVIASTVEAGLRQVEEGVDFAMLDFNLGGRDRNSLPVAGRLMESGIPFCFVSGSLSQLPDAFCGIPRISKPFHEREIEGALAAKRT